MFVRKVIYVRCICSCINVAKGIRLLDKKEILVYTGKSSKQGASTKSPETIGAIINNK